MAGLGNAAALIDDDLAPAPALHRRVAKQAHELNAPWLDLFHGFGPIIRSLYEGRTSRPTVSSGPDRTAPRSGTA